jgi:RNA polymerase sigma-70 factor (ECF subfamily)
MPAADESLIDRLRRRDVAALADFLQQQRLKLLAYIERNLGPAVRAKVEPDDVLQEVSVCAVKALPEADLSSRDPFGWLCQLAEQRIIDAGRKFSAQKRAAGREVPLDAPAGGTDEGGLIDLLIASLTTPSEAFSREQKQARLLAALAQLPEDGREALRLRYAEGLPSKEIAARLGKSDGAVRVLLTRSLARLQQLLGADGGAASGGR